MQKLLSTQEVADILGIKYLAAYRLGTLGQIPRVRVGRAWRHRPEDLQAYIMKNRTTMSAAK